MILRGVVERVCVRIRRWEMYYVDKSPHKERNTIVHVCECERERGRGGCIVYSDILGALQLLQP